MILTKRIIAGVLALIFCLTIVSCGEAESSSKVDAKAKIDSSESQAEKTTTTTTTASEQITSKADENSEETQRGKALKDYLSKKMGLYDSSQTDSREESKEADPYDSFPQISDDAVGYIMAIANGDYEEFKKYISSEEQEDNLEYFDEYDVNEEDFLANKFKSIITDEYNVEIKSENFVANCTQTFLLDTQAANILDNAENGLYDKALAEIEFYDSSNSSEKYYITIEFGNISSNWKGITAIPYSLADLDFLTDSTKYEIYNLSLMASSLGWIGMLYDTRFGEETSAFEGKINGIFASNSDYDTLKSELFTDEQLQEFRDNTIALLVEAYGEKFKDFEWFIVYENGNYSNVYIAKDDTTEIVGGLDEPYNDIPFLTDVTPNGIWSIIDNYS